ncbi:cytoplasmic protein [Thermodesulfobacteriota bacterium]
MEKVVIFAFVGDLPCFAHALINGLDMKKRGWDVKLVIEGSATRLLKDLADPAKPFASLFQKGRDVGLIDCVCRACAKTMGTLAAAEEQGLSLCDELGGHPSMARYSEAGYRIITM